MIRYIIVHFVTISIDTVIMVVLATLYLHAGPGLYPKEAFIQGNTVPCTVPLHCLDKWISEQSLTWYYCLHYPISSVVVQSWMIWSLLLYLSICYRACTSIHTSLIWTVPILIPFRDQCWYYEYWYWSSIAGRVFVIRGTPCIISWTKNLYW